MFFQTLLWDKCQPVILTYTLCDTITVQCGSQKKADKRKKWAEQLTWWFKRAETAWGTESLPFERRGHATVRSFIPTSGFILKLTSLTVCDSTDLWNAFKPFFNSLEQTMVIWQESINYELIDPNPFQIWIKLKNFQKTFVTSLLIEYSLITTGHNPRHSWVYQVVYSPYWPDI